MGKKELFVGRNVLNGMNWAMLVVWLLGPGMIPTRYKWEMKISWICFLLDCVTALNASSSYLNNCANLNTHYATANTALFCNWCHSSQPRP